VLVNNTSFNILVSYAWLGGSGNFTKTLFDASKKGIINLMIDSGAFTLFNSKTLYKHITLEGYCNFLKIYGEYCEKYVMLDVIANEEQSKRNYEYMLSEGLNPMFVFTMFDEDYKYLKGAVANNPHICVAGGVTTKGDWMVKRYQDVFMKTQAKIHALGYVKYPEMFQLPLNSVDSSSWAQSSQMYGGIVTYDNGLKVVSYKDILTKKVKMSNKLIEILEKLKVTPKVFSNIETHKGGRSIGTLLSIVANMELQKVAKRNDLNFFLSIINERQLLQMIKVNDSWNEGTLTYEKFKTY